MRRWWSSPWLELVPLAAATVLLVCRPEALPGHGLSASYYSNTDWKEPAALQVLGRHLDISMDGNLASSNETTYSIRWEGYFEASKQGAYRFMLDSDDGSMLWIDDRLVVENGGIHGRRTQEGSVQLTADEHRIRIQYFQTVGESFLRIRFKAPGEDSWSKIPLDWLLPVPAAQFDAGPVASAGLSRAILDALAGLFLILAAAHLVWLRRHWLKAFFRDSGMRRTVVGRSFANPVVHDSLCVLLCLAFYLQNIGERFPRETYMKGDSPYYANTAISIYKDFDLDQINQTDRRIFENPAPGTNISIGDSNIARGARGEWYPKHPILMPLLSVPFFAAFGGIGFVVFNVVSLLVLIVAVRRLALRFAGTGAADIAAVLIGLTPLFHHFAYSYCTDILAALLVVLGTAAVFAGRGLTSGILLGLSVWVKLPNGLAVLMAAGVLLLLRNWRVWWRYLLGCTLSLGAFAATNWTMFGAPWLTSYQRVWVIQNGASQLADHFGNFGFPFWEGFRLQLVDPIHGLFATAGIALLAVLGYWRLWKKNRGAAMALFLFSAATFLLYCKYDYVAGSHYSNRFLMPVVALAAVPLACLIDALAGRLSLPSPAPPDANDRSAPRSSIDTPR